MWAGRFRVETSIGFRFRMTQIRMVSTQPMSNVVELDQLRLQRKSVSFPLEIRIKLVKFILRELHPTYSLGSSHLISPSEQRSDRSYT